MKRPAVSDITGIIIGIGITAVVAGTVLVFYQDQTTTLSTTDSVIVTNLSVIGGSTTIEINANINNVGNTRITGIMLENVSGQNWEYRPDNEGMLVLGCPTDCNQKIDIPTNSDLDIGPSSNHILNFSIARHDRDVSGQNIGVIFQIETDSGNYVSNIYTTVGR